MKRQIDLEDILKRSIKDGECLIWTGQKTQSGGKISINNKRYSVNRLMWTIHHGEISKGHIIYHKCKNKLCINVSHMITDKRGQKQDDAGNIVSQEDIFFSYVDKTKDCFEWTGKKSPKGYGKIYFNGTSMRAHRVSYEIHYGSFNKDMNVLHHCDNPSCVNPSHLYLGNNQDNVDDKVRRNRQPNGEKNGMSKLTKDIVLQCRKMKQQGLSVSEIMQKLNLHHLDISTVCYAINGTTWKHI